MFKRSMRSIARGLLYFFIIIPADLENIALAVPASVKSEKPMKSSVYLKSFQLSDCDKINISAFNKMSDQQTGIPAPTQLDITDPQIIKNILALLASLPDEGDIMIKMGDASLLVVTLYTKTQIQHFHFYAERIKTPATSFYSESPKAEKQLYQLLISQLNQ